MKDKIQMIGIDMGCTEDLKPEYLINDKSFGMAIYKDTANKTLKVKVLNSNKFWDDMWKPIQEANAKKTPEQKAKEKKKWDDTCKNGVDTSNWVKPDTESIQNELLKHLILCEMYKEDSGMAIRYRAKVDVLYSILHSTHPSNPQSLTNFAIHDYLNAIYSELKNPLARYTYDLMDKLKNKDYTLKHRRAELKKWKAEQLAKIIEIDKK